MAALFSFGYYVQHNCYLMETMLDPISMGDFGFVMRFAVDVFVISRYD